MALKEIPAELAIVLLAVGGGIARYLSQYLNGEKFSLTFLIANIVLSGFAGLMFSLFGSSLGLSNELVYMMSGIGGFMSTESLRFVAQKMFKQLK